jgi:hypothetical protein
MQTETVAIRKARAHAHRSPRSTLDANMAYRYWSFFFHAFNGMITFAAAIAKAPGHALAPTLLYHLEDGLRLFQMVPEDHAVRKDIVSAQFQVPSEPNSLVLEGWGTYLAGCENQLIYLSHFLRV